MKRDGAMTANRSVILAPVASSPMPTFLLCRSLNINISVADAKYSPLRKAPSTRVRLSQKEQIVYQKKRNEGRNGKDKRNVAQSGDESKSFPFKLPHDPDVLLDLPSFRKTLLAHAKQLPAFFEELLYPQCINDKQKQKR
ncbi:hypothetical protein M440DRAFT_1072124 [Trichoderma longibrachiatum ATCC 18648]|uniref:Uncharacterized protein n=1 Tax=Trichoderma longibrachiatum ATCC 18648 TaxID=983965 RepID=A0A2T4BUU9_TRILO|nr:hypothetical protein M440DRAFT_1072124 [Trichoderma longibrachiatum ATCC 18648]